MGFFLKVINYVSPWKNPWKKYNKKIYKYYRISNRLHRKGLDGWANYYYNKMYSKYKCQISPSSSIVGEIDFPHAIGIVIGNGSKIGKNVTIYQNVTIGRKDKNISEYPVIEDNVIIYCNSIILGNIKIGKGAIIGAGAIVLRDVQPGEVVHGVVK